MENHTKAVIIVAGFVMSYSAASASTMFCSHPAEVNHRFEVSGEMGVYTWDDHGIARTWELKCRDKRDGSAVCHHWEKTGDKGRAVLVFHMLEDGTLIEAGAWARLDTSVVNVTPGFVCTATGE